MIAPSLFIPHGGGPLPLLGDPGHISLSGFLKECPRLFATPAAILVVSAHWEAPRYTLQGAPMPDMLYDYHGFPEESYRIRYPAPGHPALAARITGLLQDAGIAAAVDERRGFDHGLFVPLMLMYPDADIPCLQLSLLDDLDPAGHIAMGGALCTLREEGVMVLGSGSPFHNMTAFRDGATSTERCQIFDAWLYDTCCGSDGPETTSRLTHWESAPEARYAHPREEHLLPLHVCFGAAQSSGKRAERVFNGDIMGYRMSAFLWR